MTSIGTGTTESNKTRLEAHHTILHAAHHTVHAAHHTVLHAAHHTVLHAARHTALHAVHSNSLVSQHEFSNAVSGGWWSTTNRLEECSSAMPDHSGNRTISPTVQPGHSGNRGIGPTLNTVQVARDPTKKKKKAPRLSVKDVTKLLKSATKATAKMAMKGCCSCKQKKKRD